VLIGGVELAVENGLLEMDGAEFSPSVNEPDFAPVVLGEAPLTTVDRNLFLDGFTVGPTRSRKSQ